MKRNPLHKFLGQQTELLVTKKDHYLVIPLPRPKTNPHLFIDGEHQSFTEHHVSVYEEYEDGTGFRSLYHYTAYFSSYVVHVYFDKEGNQSMPYVKEQSLDSKTIIEELAPSERATIEQLISNYVDATMHQVQMLHAKQTDELYKTFYSHTNKLDTQLFETDSIKDMLELTQKAINHGALLEKISYTPRAHSRTLKYLELVYNGLLKQLHEKSPASSAGDITILPEPITAEPEPLLVTQVDIHLSVEQQHHPEDKPSDLYPQFEAHYDAATALLQFYDSISFPDFDTKILTLEKICNELGLLISYAQLIEEQPIIKDQDSLYKLSIGLESLRQSYQDKGALLLTFCLSSKPRFERFSSQLIPFASLIDKERIDAALKRNDPDVLIYLLTHSGASINQHRVQLDEGKPSISLLCAAYKMQHKECFQALVRNGANIFSSYEDELPLVHYLFCLPIADEYRQLFFNQLPHWPNSSGSIFKRLTFIIQAKLEDKELVESARSKLIAALQCYTACIPDSGANTITSRKMQDEIEKLQQYMCQDELEALRQLPEYIDRCRLQTQLADELATLARKQRKSQAVKAANNRFFKAINDQVESSEFLQAHMKGMSKQELLASMDRHIQNLQDNIYLLKNSGKVLRKKQLNEFNETHRRALAYEEEATNSAPIRSLNKISSGLDKLYEMIGIPKSERLTLNQHVTDEAVDQFFSTVKKRAMIHFAQNGARTPEAHPAVTELPAGEEKLDFHECSEQQEVQIVAQQACTELQSPGMKL